MWLNVVMTSRIAYSEVKIQVWDLVRVWWLLLSPLPHRGGGGGVGIREKNRFIVPQGVNGHMRPTAARHGRARQSSGTGPSGDCRRVLCVLGSWGQYSGKIRFIEKSGVQD